MRVIAAVFALALVLLAAWLTLRFFNRRIPGLSGGAGRMVQVLDRVNVNRTSAILLLRVQDKVLLVGISDHAVQKLAEFDDPDGTMVLPDAKEYPSFSAALKDAVGRFQKKDGDGGEDR